MSGLDTRKATLGKLAWACAALVLAITSLSAFIRLSRAGLGCEPWPQCYAQVLQATGQPSAAPTDGAVGAARIAHRVVAVVALLMVIALVMTTLSKEPMLWREGRMALGLLALALFLAILGRWTTDARLPAVMLGNLLAGFTMLALSWRLVQSVSHAPERTAAPDRVARWAKIGAALLAVQIVLGGLVSAGHAGLSCPQLLACDTAGGSWQFLNPWHETPIDIADPANPAGALVHALHRAGALAVAAVLLPLGVAAWRDGRRTGAAVMVLLLLQAALGALLVIAGLPLWLALAHNIVAALLLAAVLGLAAGRKRWPTDSSAAARQRRPKSGS
ncbi:MAG TPA: COX15/CtaA family protein [Ramlibacter sp.]|nr:COX15/CtaA family protein [Ramlibacter sp.]